MKDKILVILYDFLASCLSLVIVSPLALLSLILITFFAKVAWWLILLTWSIW